LKVKISEYWWGVWRRISPCSTRLREDRRFCSDISSRGNNIYIVTNGWWGCQLPT
jgi:hypothetical protein